MNKKFVFGIVALFAVTLGLPIGADAAYYGHNWRHQVLRRDNILANEIHQNRGCLTGHYGHLMNEQQAVRRQAAFDARMNGGGLSPVQVRHLNHEENRIQNQINHDHRW